jgi:peptidoglycan L-alanyl-D-glutamate endopeptidase CwlK
MAFILGPKSTRELEGVKPELVAVARRAIAITTQDFAITDGLRTAAEQKELLARGATTTLNSKHLTGDAVDAVPVVAGKPRWEWPLTYAVAAAFQIAAGELGTRLRWGGVWDKVLNELPPGAAQLEEEVNAYVARRRRLGRRAFIDGPHFELI